MNEETLKQKEKAKAIIKDKNDVKKQIQKYVETLSNKNADYVSELECLGDFTRKARLLEESDCTFVKNTRILIDVANGYFQQVLMERLIHKKKSLKILNLIYSKIFMQILNYLQ